MALSDKIDVHHHFVPADIDFDFTGPGPLQDLKVAASRMPAWSPEKTKDCMSKTGAATAILSFPILFAFDEQKGVKIARAVNEYAAKLRDAEPMKFGFFAAIPSLHNTEAALEEIRYCLDTLKADGVLLLARYGASYLGDPSFKPIWAELDRQSAVVHVHPGTTFRSEKINPYVDPAIAEFPHETTNTALDMILNDTVRAHRHCKIILSHAGGTLPYLVGRATALIPFFAAHVSPPPKSAQEILEDARLFYFDLALSSTPYVLDTLLENFPRDHILYGSDFPFAPPPAINQLANTLNEYEMDSETRHMVYRKNACALFPRLQG
ncbi:uncharacterized protein LTR77_008291 [Saxophila tyrrhenica]|uniref:6-methylsalicylate decarboxylase n=1 Tax=Saxophila tyrrhenica TaxID=1690608 RepID=A0AAV9P485_9PEZI|nr:hypothetical protein LTR77_008291 [Saxophila tyrrhenica]